MKISLYFQSGPYVAYECQPGIDAQVFRACCRPGAAAIAQTDYSLLPLCAPCSKEQYEAIRAAALQELGLVDQEALYMAQIEAYEAKGVVSNYLDLLVQVEH